MTLSIPENFNLALYVALGMSLALPFLVINIKIAPRLGWVDWPKARGLSEDQVPIVGLSLVLGSFVYLATMAWYGKVSGFFVASTFLIGAMGFFDDLYPRPALDKMLIQIFCVVCVVLFDPGLQKAISQAYGPWGTFWAIFFILGLMNSINFIDGIDGLAGSVLFFGGLALYLFTSGHPESKGTGIYGGLLMGMLVPFLYFNVIQRKGFLGNVGSYTLSYLLAVQHLSIPLESSNIISRLALPGLCFLVPIADAATVLVYRIGSRRSPFQADKGHLHHRLLQSSLPLRYILLVMGVIELLGVFVAMALTHNLNVSSGWLAPMVCITHTLTVSLLIVLVEKTSKQRLQGYFSHLDQGKSVYYLKYKLSHPKGGLIPLQTLKRLEARINTEIRVTDLCFLQGPDTLFVMLRNLSEPFKGISARLDRVFEQEQIRHALTVEQGEIVRISDQDRIQRRAAFLAN
ncbi:undecaprenyl/decaprenyl-phosphate alpha-N-acetylglucosaminyl 1-phosphate transferase [bacterium]|nr:undecaprenyl/decaprenyl-phosphate alpha-N-acetylglucosaminyl 1-phosphate transferase [bacterium]